MSCHDLEGLMVQRRLLQFRNVRMRGKAPNDYVDFSRDQSVGQSIRSCFVDVDADMWPLLL